MTPPEISRRNFCKWSSSLLLAGIFTGLKGRSLLALDPSATAVAQVPEAVNELHIPKLIVPAVTRNGAQVPIIGKMNHPMEQNHYIRQIEFLNESDPIPSKGVFYPTPANGELYVAFQARMHSGTSTIKAVAECNLHGKWTGRHQITIPEGQGGCATADGTKRTEAKDEILPPVIRIPELVRRGRLVKGETAEVQVKFKHPSKTGLLYENKKFIQAEEPLFVKSMEVFYDDRPVSRYEMTPGLSDNPFLRFKLKFAEAKRIRIFFTNSLGRQFSAFTEVVLS
jgi:sulfur-oxidizing protein SoxY